MSNYNPWQTSASQYGGPDAWKARPPVGKGKGQVTSKMAEEARRNVVNLPGTYERTSDLTGGHAQDFVQDAERERRRKFNITGSGHQQHASSSSAYRYEGGASGTRRTQQQSGRVGGGGGTRGPGGGAGAAGPRYHSPAPAMGGATHRVANGVNRAVFVGVNYIGGEAPLTGCINDVNNAMSHLQKWGFSASEKNNFRMLTEEEPDQRRNGPTKKNILEAIAWLVSGATPGETLFFHFSGHGTQAADLNADEEDGFDEAICPVDYARNGLITDDELRVALIDTLPQGVTLYCVFDCCHSGTILDLRFIYNQKRDRLTLQTKVPAPRANVFLITGCLSKQTSADLPPGFKQDLNKSVGALSNSLYPAIGDGLSWRALISRVRKEIKRSKLTQIPQLEGGNDFSLDETAFALALKNVAPPPPPPPADPSIKRGINRAVFVGINYTGSSAPLTGCVNDAKLAFDTMRRIGGLRDAPRESYIMLTEEPGQLAPTRRNILRAMRWLVKGAKPGEVLWWHLSGHGLQVADTTGDEADGMDEAIAPIDYETAGVITDDDINDILVDSIPEGVVLYVVFDCCHSSSLCDTRFFYDATTRTLGINDEVPRVKGGQVIMLSGCKSDQTSADLPPGFSKKKALDKSIGALSSTLYPMLASKPSWGDLIERTRKSLKKAALTQIPQLEASQDFDATQRAYEYIWTNPGGDPSRSGASSEMLF